MTDSLPARRMPCQELREVLIKALAPCPNVRGTCQNNVRWKPEEGHIPRGICGACGSLDDVELVLIVAEPGDPHDGERYPLEASPEEYLAKLHAHAWDCFEHGRDQFHRNIRSILDACFPNEGFETQMRKTWITESVLCSARKEGDSVPMVVSRTCVNAYLDAQLQLLAGRTVALLGGKAQKRARYLVRAALRGASVAPPGCNFLQAKESWKIIAINVKKRRESLTNK